VATTGAAADEHLLAEVFWQHRRLSKLAVSELVADAKYGTATNYLSLDQAGFAAFIPPTRFGHQHTGIWGRERSPSECPAQAPGKRPLLIPSQDRPRIVLRDEQRHVLPGEVACLLTVRLNYSIILWIS
jgi:hypothetical protein